MTDRGGRFIGEYAVGTSYLFCMSKANNGMLKVQDTTRNHVEVVKEGDILRSE